VRNKLAMAVTERDDSPNLSGLESFSFEPQRIEKPWGYELVWAHSEHYCGKILFVRAGEELSLQFHNRKDETVFLQRGKIEIEISEPGVRIPESEIVSAGAAFRIRPGVIHRWRALEDSVVLEASTPHLDDVVRLEDRYGRSE
jgi:mannose-6-phosphate isomerase